MAGQSHNRIKILLFCLASLEEDSCGCEVPCSKITYITDVSYSKFPNRITAQTFIQDGYYDDIEYQR